MKHWGRILLCCLLLCPLAGAWRASAPPVGQRATRAGEAAEGRTQYTAKIKAIAGNEVTLELGTLGGAGNGGGRAGRDGARAGAPGAGKSGGKPAALPDGDGMTPMRAEGGPALQGEGGTALSRAGSGRAGRASADGAGTESAAFEKSGETQTLLIPVKTPVYAAGNASAALSFSQLAVGQVVTLTAAEREDGTAYLVSIQVVDA